MRETAPPTCCPLWLRLFLLALLFPPLSTVHGAQVTIEKLLPFAGADQIRIEATIQSDQDLPGVELLGQITPWPQGEPLWTGPLGKQDLKARQKTVITQQLTALKPKLWSCTSPNLYQLIVTVQSQAQPLAQQKARFGFRSFETHDGQFYLNGHPIFLRGNSINPPGRGVPQDVGMSRPFIEAYLRDLKARHVNFVRVGTDPWQDTCDELGIMVFHGRYGGPRGGSKNAPPADLPAAIERYQSEYFEGYQKHPSVVVSILSNEMPYKGPAGEAFGRFFDQVHAVLKTWDPNRLYIGNAGFGQGRGGDIYDSHPYWGWYGGDFLTNYSRLRWKDHPRKLTQPWTFSECVGSYTTPEGPFNVGGKLLGNALGWTGHCPQQADKALRYQAFLSRQFIEIQRRLRPINPNLAGIMPFTFIWHHWQDITRFEDMMPKPVADQLAVSYQPILLSWETWTPQVYAGSTLRAIAHVVNDADDCIDLRGAKLLWELRDKEQKKLIDGEADLPVVPYYQVRALPVAIQLPRGLPTGDYTLAGRILQGQTAISTNTAPLFIAARDFCLPASAALRPGTIGPALSLYDPLGKTAAALQRLGIPFHGSNKLELPDPSAPLIVGEDAWDQNLSKHAQILKRFLQSGGRLLVLRPDPKLFDASWLGTDLRPFTRDGMWINLERPDHPAFAGLDHWKMEWWSDYTAWDQTQKELPRLHPATLSYALPDADALARTAVLADYGTGLRCIALCEVFNGKGSAILCGFDLVARSGLDPVADRLLTNLIQYAAGAEGHNIHPLVDSPIVWGNYATERGVVVTSQQGLLIHQAKDKPRGRRPFGPFHYGGPTGGYVIDPKPESPTGSGLFHARIPADRKTMLTTVENPTPSDQKLQIQINKTATDYTIPPGKTLAVETPLPRGSTDLSIRYAGHKSLVLLDTNFR